MGIYAHGAAQTGFFTADRHAVIGGQLLKLPVAQTVYAGIADVKQVSGRGFDDQGAECCHQIHKEARRQHAVRWFCACLCSATGTALARKAVSSAFKHLLLQYLR